MNAIGEKNILVSITTAHNSDWRAKIKEAAELGIATCALFPTDIGYDERKECYRTLEKSPIRACPMVHLRHDTRPEEIDYLVKRYRTQAFNVHCRTEYPLAYDLSKYARRLFVENVYHVLKESELKRYGGVCLDFAHLENDRRRIKSRYAVMRKTFDSHKIGCNHISAVIKNTLINSEGHTHHDRHHYENLREFDYLARYPERYFSDFCALELENTLSEQLGTKDYNIKLLNNRWQRRRPFSG